MQKKKLVLAAGMLLGIFAFFSGCAGESETSKNDEYEYKSYTVTYVDEEGNSVGADTASGYGSASVYLNYKKEGYTVTYYDSDGNKITGYYSTTKDCKITVKCTPISYTIHFEKSSYDYRTVSGALPDDISCVYDTEYTLPENNLSCSSYGTTYKARGWTKDKSNYSKVGDLKSGSTVKNLTATDGATVTLYPCFSNDDSFTLKFYTSTGTYASTTTVYADAGETLSASQIPAATKTGYKHTGYYLSGDSTQTATDFSTYTVASDATFYPIFTIGTYTATFVTEHGTAPADVSWTYSDSYSEKTDISSGSYVLTATGYTFDGWYKEGDSYKTAYIYHNTSKDITLTAKWTPWTATISYNANRPVGVSSYGGTMYKMTVKYDTAENLKPNAYYVTGYTFTGWNTKADGSGTSYANEESYTWSGSANNETVTLYAQWEKTQTALSVAIVSPSTSTDITLSYNSTANNFKATLAGSSIFTWYIDGTKVENETNATISAYKLSAGQHSVMVTSEMNGRTYGTTIVVQVTVSE